MTNEQRPWPNRFTDTLTAEKASVCFTHSFPEQHGTEQVNAVTSAHLFWWQKNKKLKRDESPLDHLEPVRRWAVVSVAAGSHAER